MKISRILCPSDSSETSAHAIDHAAMIAGYYHARITALHVLTPPRAMSDLASSAEEAAEVERLRQATAQEFASATAKGIGVDILVDVGEPVAAILERASELAADLIVMGTHGIGGFQRLVLGSVTERVLRKSSTPVLTVPPRATATSQLPFVRLLCAVDFSGPSLAALQAAYSLAIHSRAEVTLLHVLQWPWDEPPAPSLTELPREQGLALAEFRRYTEDSAGKRLMSLVPNDLPAGRVATAIRNGKSYVQILNTAAEERADLIVIGVRGRNPLDMMLFGSTANQVVRHATCPVLTVH